MDKNKNVFWFDNVESRPHPWPGLVWITSIIQVADVKASKDLYVNAFEFVPIFEFESPEKPDEQAMVRLRYRGTNFVITNNDYDGQSPAASNSKSPFVFYVYFDDAVAAFNRAVKAGMEVLQEPKETFWGDIRARVKCINGYVWDIAQRKM